MSQQNLRNICIIAHVDHGKTTLVDHMLRQAGTFQAHETLTDRVMDSMDLERERGITIAAKNASLKFNNHTINIVDTPGHADFGGEVERIMGMVDGAILLVDGAEGPLPQTRFVLQKALQQGHKIILVINKVDRPECQNSTRVQEVINQTFDLFLDLGANDEQAHFPIFYACAREGWITENADEVPELIAKEKKGSLVPLFEKIIQHVNKPKILDVPQAQLLVSNFSYSNYMGRLAIGRLLSGTLKRNQKLFCLGATRKEPFTATRLYRFDGLKQVETEEIHAGDIAIVAGCETVDIGDTITDSDTLPALPRLVVEKPTLAVIFSVNTSPLSGKEGTAIQSRQLRERLIQATRLNVALKFSETEYPDQFRMLGRGELQFAILIEQMRREGVEFMVGKPIVLYQTDPNGSKLEPMEKVTLDLPEFAVGDVTRLFQERKGILAKYENMGHSNTSPRVRLEFDIPTRGVLGIRSKYLTLTKGEGLMSSELIGYGPDKGFLAHRVQGALIADRTGDTMEYALLTLEERGVLFVGPGVEVYEGMIIGENNRENDLNVNPCKEKKLTNIRAAHAEVLVTLKGIREMPLERCLEWIDEDEWIEITPQSVRIRKKVLPQNLRSVKRGED